MDQYRFIVRPSVIQLGVKNKKCHERRHQIILRRSREEEGGRGRNVDDAVTSSAGKKLACRSIRMEGRRRKVRVLFLDTFHFAAAANCNRATDRQPALSSCNFVV